MQKFTTRFVLALCVTGFTLAAETSRELDEARKIIESQSCADCSLDTAAVLEALATVSKFAQGKDNLVAKKLQFKALYDLSVLHFYKGGLEKDKYSIEAAKLANQLFKDYPNDFEIAENYLITRKYDSPERLAAAQRKVNLKPADAQSRFDLGLYQFIFKHEEYRVTWKLAFSLITQAADGRNYLDIVVDQMKQRKCNSNSLNELNKIMSEFEELERGEKIGASIEVKKLGIKVGAIVISTKCD